MYIWKKHSKDLLGKIISKNPMKWLSEKIAKSPRIATSSKLMFRFISPIVPTKNRTPKRKAKDQRTLHRYLENEYGVKKGSLIFSPDLRLKVHFYYFCHETHAAKDIHNIIEPFIDDLQDYLFDNDK